MADYKVVDAETLDAGLTTIADAIRERAGTSEALSFPEGFKRAVVGIPDYLAMRLNNGGITEYSSSEVTQVYNHSFASCTKLVSVSLPNATHAQFYSFNGCGALESVSMPNAWFIGQSAFGSCKALPKVDFPSVSRIYSTAFSGCSTLETVILRISEGVCTLDSISAFNNTPIASGTGYIYVPRTLVDSYKAATNWSSYADQIRAIEDYPEITGGAT